MKLIDQSHHILMPTDFNRLWHSDELYSYFINGMRHCEMAGRLAYNSVDKMTPDSYKTFLKGIIKSGHCSVLEHFSFSVKFETSRSVTHELVRHRHCAYTQQSQRYINYSLEKHGGGDIKFIKPIDYDQYNAFEKDRFESSCKMSEMLYNDLTQQGMKPQLAREVLPNATASQIIVTASFREWRSIFELRCAKDAHPQIRSLMINLHQDLRKYAPEVFDFGHE